MPPRVQLGDGPDWPGQAGGAPEGGQQAAGPVVQVPGHAAEEVAERVEWIIFMHACDGRRNSLLLNELWV